MQSGRGNAGKDENEVNDENGKAEEKNGEDEDEKKAARSSISFSLKKETGEFMPLLLLIS